MKIAIIADTHDNLPNTAKAAGWIAKEKIKTIIHCGDIFKSETIEKIQENFTGSLHIVFSPADASFSEIPKDSFKNFKRVKVYEEFGEIKIPASPAGGGGRKIAFCHFPEIAEGLVARQEYDFVFYGHTHRPWIKKIGKTKLVNPGNLANLFYKATFATYDTKTDKLELKILEKL